MLDNSHPDPRNGQLSVPDPAVQALRTPAAPYRSDTSTQPIPVRCSR
jgi:hypothetical protein